MVAGLAVEQPGIAVTVVDVVACLSAGSVVHVEYEEEFRLAAPLHQAVHACKAVLPAGDAHVVFVGKELVVEGKADGVGAGALDEADVLARHVVVLELLPELGGEVGSHQLAEHLVDEVPGVGLAEAEHVSLGVEPVAQVGAHDEKLLTVGLDEVVSLDGYKLGCRGGFFPRLRPAASCQAHGEGGQRKGGHCQ